jgi:hypothetical protein
VGRVTDGTEEGIRNDHKKIYCSRDNPNAIAPYALHFYMRPQVVHAWITVPPSSSEPLSKKKIPSPNGKRLEFGNAAYKKSPLSNLEEVRTLQFQ